MKGGEGNSGGKEGKVLRQGGNFSRPDGGGRGVNFFYNSLGKRKKKGGTNDGWESRRPSFGTVTSVKRFGKKKRI